MNTTTQTVSDPAYNHDTVVFYHAHCADGFAAAYVAWSKLKDTAGYKAINYGEPVADDEYADKTVYILDFSFPREIMDNIFKLAKKVVWLDHHKTAFEMYGLVPNNHSDFAYDDLDLGVAYKGENVVMLDNMCSGAMLSWKYFFGNVYYSHNFTPKLISHIDDRDRWQFKLEGSKEFHAALMARRPWTFESWEELFEKTDSAIIYPKMYEEGKLLIASQQLQMQSIIEATEQECTIVFYVSGVVPNPHEDNQVYSTATKHLCKGLAVNAPAEFASEIGNKLAIKSGTYGLVWWMNSLGKINISLRSMGDYDVSYIAKQFGGGGHKNAAGFTLPDLLTFTKWLYPNRQH